MEVRQNQSTGVQTAVDIIDQLLEALNKNGYRYRIRWEMTDVGGVIHQRLVQIFFTNDDMIRRSRRFASACLMKINATFGTNNLKMPLVVVVGIDNCDATFNIAFSYIRTESTTDYSFVLQNLQGIVFVDCPLPKVVLADQGEGIQAALKKEWASLDVISQLCEWHCFTNIQKRVYRSRTYTEKSELQPIWTKVLA